MDSILGRSWVHAKYSCSKGVVRTTNQNGAKQSAQLERLSMLTILNLLGVSGEAHEGSVYQLWELVWAVGAKTC